MTSEDDKLKNALALLESRASELFEDPQTAEGFRSLVKKAQSHKNIDKDAQRPPHLEELEALVHTVVSIEDSILEVKGAADLVLDWLSKSGRSLGLD